MDFFSVQNILVHIPIGAGGYDLSWIEAVGTIAGLLCIGLASMEKISNYFFGLINVTLFGIIFFQIQLYASLLLQVFFFAANIYGWYAWSRQTSQNEAELKIRWLPLPKALSWLAVCVVSIGLMTVFINPVFAFLTRVAVMIMQALGLQVAMPELQPDAFPFWDSCMMVLSIVAMILMTRKYVENWLLWVIINVISVVIFALQGVYAMSLEYIILTFIACYELIEMITQHNNMAQFEPALIMRWIFKTAISVWLISNTFDIVMAVFDITQKVVSDSSGIIAGNTRVNDIGLSMLQSSLMQMDVGPLFGLFLQSFFIGITMRILSIVIFVIVYGRMIEIYCMVSLAPIPMATFGNHEQSHMGQNYLKCLFALGFQGFLILICVAIYAVLIQSVAISGDAINSIWSIVGYTVLLCFSLFKTSSVTKSVLGAH